MMVTKAIFGLAALLGLAGVGLSLSESRAGCCGPGAECCFPGSPCCADDCCAPGAVCCVPGAACCDTAASPAGCCAPGADCCFPGSPCCTDDCCAPGSPCCVTGAGCCDLTAAGANRVIGRTAADQPGQFAKVDAATSTIAVDGMTCAGCAKTVGKAVSAVEGVESAVADVKTKTLTVTAKKGATPSPKSMWEAVEKAGYTPTRIEGAAGTFDKKPTK